MPIIFKTKKTLDQVLRKDVFFNYFCFIMLIFYYKIERYGRGFISIS